MSEAAAKRGPRGKAFVGYGLAIIRMLKARGLKCAPDTSPERMADYLHRCEVVDVRIGAPKGWRWFRYLVHALPPRWEVTAYDPRGVEGRAA